MELEITQNGMNGEGVAKINGKVYFVHGAVMGDRVTAKVIKENKNFCIAEINEILKFSCFRSVPKCKYFGICGGCNLQHIEYKKQLQIKTQNVQNLFDKNKLNFKINNCIESKNIFNYRNKLTLYLSKNNKLSFYQKNTKTLIEIDNCCLVDEIFNNLIHKINLFLSNNKEYNCFVLKGMAIRKIENNFIINLILNKKIILTKFEQFLKLNKINYSLYYCVNNRSNLPTYPCNFVGGAKEVYIEEFGIKYLLKPMSFLQVNNDIKYQIYKQIISIVKQFNNVLDAYSGAGLLSAVMAKNCKNVFAVELDESAHEACLDLCKVNKIKNLQAICGDCANEIPKLLNDNSMECIVLDPARKGCDEKVLSAILSALPKQIVYLSCNPATLTRDLKVLCESGHYELLYVQPYDMFPQTSEVETLVVLKQTNK